VPIAVRVMWEDRRIDPCTTRRGICQTSSVAIFDLDLALEKTGKALAPHPAFQDSTTPVSTYSPGGKPREKALISQQEAMRHATAYGGSQAIDWVYDAINLYADAASSADWVLENSDGTRLVREKSPTTPSDYKVGPAGLYRLLDQPNEHMLYDELMALLVIDLLLVGNGYWVKWRTNTDGQPLALYRLAPSYVKIKPGDQGPIGYEYQPPGAKKIILKPEDVIHFRRPNPHSFYYGLGVIQGAGRSMDIELAVTDTIASYYENRADPSLIVQSEKRVPRDVFHKLRAQLRARAGGSKNAGELLVLEAGLAASTLDRSAADSLFADLAGMSQFRVYAKFRAHPSLFGVPGTTSGSDKVSDIRAEFDNSVLRPFFKKLSVQISKALAEAWDVRFRIDHRSTLPAEEQLKVGAEVSAVPYIKVREVRRQYAQFGIAESTGDSEIDEKLLNEPTPEADANGQVTLADGTKVNSATVGSDKPIGSEPGRPPKPANTRSPGSGKPTGKAVADIETAAMKRIAGRTSTGALPTIEDLLADLEAKAVSTDAPDNRLPGEHRPTDGFAAARAADITSLTNLMEERLIAQAQVLERELLDQVESGKALKTSDIVSRLRNSAAWKSFRERIKGDLLDGMQRASSSAVMHSGLTPDEEIDYESIADEVLNRKGGLNSIVKTLKDRVANAVKAARDSDGERHDYNAAVQSAIKDWTSAQARTIAETEAVHAYNEATLTTGEAAGVTQWYVTDGDDHDEPCAEAHGQVWDTPTARERRLEHPRCRRAFLPLTPATVE
jgi:HK97 family phage portal protein